MCVELNETSTILGIVLGGDSSEVNVSLSKLA